MSEIYPPYFPDGNGYWVTYRGPMFFTVCKFFVPGSGDTQLIEENQEFSATAGQYNQTFRVSDGTQYVSGVRVKIQLLEKQETSPGVWEWVIVNYKNFYTNTAGYAYTNFEAIAPSYGTESEFIIQTAIFREDGLTSQVMESPVFKVKLP
jgi:hypothetical protein